MTPIIALVALSILSATPPRHAPAHKAQSCDAEALRCLVLDEMFPEFGDIRVYVDTSPPERLDKAERRLREIRGWSRSLDACTRSAYEEWLTFYEGEVRDARAALRRKPERDAEEKRREREDAMKKAHCARYRETHPPIPKPPRPSAGTARVH